MINTTKHAVPILATLNALNKKHKKFYSYPAQLTIMKLLAEFQGIKIEIATLNRWLRDIEDEGLINRVRRTRHDKKLGMVFQSTLYNITNKGYHILKAVGVDVWREMKQSAKAGFKAADKTLSEFKEFASIRQIMAAATIFGVQQKKPIKEET